VIVVGLVDVPEFSSCQQGLGKTLELDLSLAFKWSATYDVRWLA